MLPNFKITANQKITKLLHTRNIKDFHSAVRHIHNLPYGRIKNVEKPSRVITEGKGTCSTKHACLKLLAEENMINSVELHMSIYAMREENTPGVGKVLAQYGLEYILEAHVYLCYGKERFDYTFPGTTEKLWENDIIVETAIDADQIGEFKKEYHQSYLKDWIERDNISYSFDEIWGIREECIKEFTRK